MAILASWESLIVSGSSSSGSSLPFSSAIIFAAAARAAARTAEAVVSRPSGNMLVVGSLRFSRYLVSTIPSVPALILALLLVALFHLFFTAFSDLPGKSFAIFVQQFPHLAWASTSIASSSSVQPPFFKLGSRWLNQRSRHCLPILPGMRSAISDHFVIPASMQSMMIWSSSFVHGPLTNPGCRTFCHLWRHWTSLLWSPRKS
mmetsp:Transcript_13020/g.25864  ORF Transcript_13020/g.25864 Transcript_13020/m.25864 type:complete len:203 (-) Transcript_13020:976-1584(-)